MRQCKECHELPALPLHPSSPTTPPAPVLPLYPHNVRLKWGEHLNNGWLKESSQAIVLRETTLPLYERLLHNKEVQVLLQGGYNSLVLANSCLPDYEPKPAPPSQQLLHADALLAAQGRMARERGVLPVADHLSLLCSQYLLSSLYPHHPNYLTVTQLSGPRSMKHILQSCFLPSIAHLLSPNRKCLPSTYRQSLNFLHSSAVQQDISAVGSNKEQRRSCLRRRRLDHQPPLQLPRHPCPLYPSGPLAGPGVDGNLPLLCPFTFNLSTLASLSSPRITCWAKKQLYMYTSSIGKSILSQRCSSAKPHFSTLLHKRLLLLQRYFHALARVYHAPDNALPVKNPSSDAGVTSHIPSTSFAGCIDPSTLPPPRCLGSNTNSGVRLLSASHDSSDYLGLYSPTEFPLMPPPPAEYEPPCQSQLRGGVGGRKGGGTSGTEALVELGVQTGMAMLFSLLEEAWRMQRLTGLFLTQHD
ncbi:hypothetical protein FHG87_023974 [Trinorchestia longiramus]|nr:hypothetical protein FHG87_023974 [Trinorchestia longiramus]